MNNTNTPDRVVREREREHITGMPKASWYALPEDERPKQIKLSARAVAWSYNELLAWVEQKKASRAP
jgi:predicted DNA-binding transcriptional regulator AlpA